MSWTDQEIADYDNWLDKHDLFFQITVNEVDTFKDLLSKAYMEMDVFVNRHYLQELFERYVEDHSLLGS